MTAPRAVVPGRTYHFCRRCSEGRFFQRPDAEVEAIYAYCLAEAASHFNITLHAWKAMSNHQHVIFTDNDGNYPAFLARLDKHLAKALNAHWGRWESVWASSQQPVVVRLLDKEAAFDKLLYVVGNGVAADLVEHVADWPGACSYAQHLSGRDRVVKRPRTFGKKSKMPAAVTLTAARLPGFENLSVEEWRAKVVAGVEALEERHRRRRRDEKRRVLGRKTVLRQHWSETPDSPLPRFRRRPLVVASDRDAHAREIEAIIAFRIAHRAALERLRARERGVVFPAGTYRVRLFGVRCEDELGVIIAPPPMTTRASA